MRIIIVTAQHDRARDLMRQHGLRPTDVHIVHNADELGGLFGIRRDPIRGATAIYADGWWDRKPYEDQLRLVEMLRVHGFNGPFE